MRFLTSDIVASGIPDRLQGGCSPETLEGEAIARERERETALFAGTPCDVEFRPARASEGPTRALKGSDSGLCDAVVGCGDAEAGTAKDTERERPSARDAMGHAASARGEHVPARSLLLPRRYQKSILIRRA